MLITNIKFVYFFCIWSMSYYSEVLSINNFLNNLIKQIAIKCTMNQEIICMTNLGTTKHEQSVVSMNVIMWVSITGFCFLTSSRSINGCYIKLSFSSRLFSYVCVKIFKDIGSHFPEGYLTPTDSHPMLCSTRNKGEGELVPGGLPFINRFH